MRGGLDAAIARGLAYAPYADLIWCETSTPDLDEARRYAEAIHARYPGKLLAYNCSPSFNWEKKLDASTIARFQRELGAMGYKFQFVTLAGFHALNFSMFELARDYRGARHERVRGPAAGGVRGRGGGVHGDQTPARGGDRLLRQRGRGDLGRPVVDHRFGRIDGGGSSSTDAVDRESASVELMRSNGDVCDG